MSTTTLQAQKEVEELVLSLLRETNPFVYALWSAKSNVSDADCSNTNTENSLTFYRKLHAQYLKERLRNNKKLSASLQGLYPAQPWLSYWTLQAATLLNITEEVLYDLNPNPQAANSSSSSENEEKRKMSASSFQEAIEVYLLSCLCEETDYIGENLDQEDEIVDKEKIKKLGFGGGPRGQGPHLATSYAAVCALAILLSDSDKSAGDDNTKSGWEQLPRLEIKKWLLSLKQTFFTASEDHHNNNSHDGSSHQNGCSFFSVFAGGESDIRALYCVAVISTLLRLDDPLTFASYTTQANNASDKNAMRLKKEIQRIVETPLLDLSVLRYITACQTHEGGFSCHAEGFTHVASTSKGADHNNNIRFYKGAEAHGAYTHCGVACYLLVLHAVVQPLQYENNIHDDHHHHHDVSGDSIRGNPVLLGREIKKCIQQLNLHQLERWLTARQLQFEGGFNGRTNKLVDSCYSHWIGNASVCLEVIKSYHHSLFDLLHRNNGDEQKMETKNIITAKEIFFLDFAQFVNVENMMICASDAQQISAWDTAEVEKQKQKDILEQFLSADDSTRRRSLAQRATKRKAEENLIQLEGQKGKNSDGNSTVGEANNRLHEELYENKYSNNNNFNSTESELAGDLCFNQKKLQIYVISCCQNNRANPIFSHDGTGNNNSNNNESSDNSAEGGMVDKPNCPNDFYHTCYSLSGLSASENLFYFHHKRHFFSTTKNKNEIDNNNANGVKLESFMDRAMEKKYIPKRKTISEMREQYNNENSSYALDLGIILPNVHLFPAAPTHTNANASAINYQNLDFMLLNSTNPIFNINRNKIVTALSTLGPKTFL